MGAGLSDQDYFRHQDRTSSQRWHQHQALTASPMAPIDVSDLRETAAVNIAIALWNHVNIPVALFEASPNTLAAYYEVQDAGVDLATFKWDRVISKVCKLADKLPIPNSVAKYIEKVIGTMGDRVDEWVSYHNRTVFFEADKADHLYYHVPYFAWYSDGTIDNEQTARNLLSSLRLSFVEKYKLLCTYCLKDEMEEMIPQLLSNNVREVVAFTSYPLIYYWDRYFRNQLSTIPVPRNTSIDSFMFRHTAVDNWPAKKYFFNRLSSEEKIQNAIQLIDTRGVEYQRLMFTQLSEFERMQVYMQRAEKIVTNYMSAVSDCRHILSAWFEMRFLISAEQFSSLFHTLLKSYHPPIPPHLLHLVFAKRMSVHNENLQRVLKEIWISAGDDFRNHLIGYNDYEIISRMFQLRMKNTDINDLLFTILSNVSPYHKKKIINLPFFDSYCDRLLSGEDVQEFNRLLNVFLPAAVDQNSVQFKEDVVLRSAYVRSQCLIFYSTGRVDHVNKWLTKLLPTTHSAVLLEFKKNLLLSSEGINECVDNGILNLNKCKLNAVMVDLDSFLSKDLIAEFKRKLVFSSSAIKVFRGWVINNKIADVKYFIENCLVSDEDKKVLKRRLLTVDDYTSCTVTLFSRCNREWIQNFFEWCLEDDNGAREFKSTLPVDDIFNELLKRAIFSNYDRRLSKCRFQPPGSFDTEIEPLNHFLNWYFNSYDEVKKYKLRRINSYRSENERGVIKTLLRKKDHYYFRITLAWFLDNDRK
ncbi:uncharacterized protein LOC135849065 [Planococcus citri]|uniref:uncharacterized protein LOC135849065 n=1 Tax=Planococcus citri TaxID=170843 RepID=UPI0031F7C2AF